MYLQKLKQMFSEMVLKKDSAVISHYYHPEFLLYTNEEVMAYSDFVASHQKYFATPIKYEIQYDEETLVEQAEKIAARVWITTCMPDEPARKIEVILIAQYKDEKIYRLWELTYPDWSKLPAFQG
jgi:hypothetical protein